MILKSFRFYQVGRNLVRYQTAAERKYVERTVDTKMLPLVTQIKIKIIVIEASSKIFLSVRGVVVCQADNIPLVGKTL